MVSNDGITFACAEDAHYTYSDTLPGTGRLRFPGVQYSPGSSREQPYGKESTGVFARKERRTGRGGRRTWFRECRTGLAPSLQAGTFARDEDYCHAKPGGE